MRIAAESRLLGDLGDTKICMCQQPFGSFQSCTQHILDDGDAISLLIQAMQTPDANLLVTLAAGFVLALVLFLTLHLLKMRKRS